MAGRSAGAISSARSVSDCRSRSKVRPERQRSRKRNRDPQDARRPIFGRLPFLDQREREEQHARNGEEQRRVRDLEAADFDGEVLLEHEPRAVRQSHDSARPMIAPVRRAKRSRDAPPPRPCDRRGGTARCRAARPRDRDRVSRAPRSRRSSRSPRSRATSAAVDASSRPVNGSSSSTRRGP